MLGQVTDFPPFVVAVWMDHTVSLHPSIDGHGLLHILASVSRAAVSTAAHTHVAGILARPLPPSLVQSH